MLSRKVTGKEGKNAALASPEFMRIATELGWIGPTFQNIWSQKPGKIEAQNGMEIPFRNIDYQSCILQATTLLGNKLVAQATFVRCYTTKPGYDNMLGIVISKTGPGGAPIPIIVVSGNTFQDVLTWMKGYVQLDKKSNEIDLTELLMLLMLFSVDYNNPDILKTAFQGGSLVPNNWSSSKLFELKKAMTRHGFFDATSHRFNLREVQIVFETTSMVDRRIQKNALIELLEFLRTSIVNHRRLSVNDAERIVDQFLLTLKEDFAPNQDMKTVMVNVEKDIRILFEFIGLEIPLAEDMIERVNICIDAREIILSHNSPYEVA